MKTPGWLLRRRWFLVAVLSLLVAFSPMMLTASPAHAESTFDGLLAGLQQWRPQYGQLLASYQQADAGLRAQVDAVLVQLGMPQHQLSFYNALSAGNQAELDKEARRVTGYTFSQLAQGTSTLPGLVKVMDVLIAALPHFSGGGVVPSIPITPPPVTEPPATTPPPVTEPPATTPPSGTMSFEPPAQGGEVSFKEAGYDWKPLSPAGQAMSISDGCAVRTGQGSVVIRDFPEQGDQLSVGQNTQFQIAGQGTILDGLKGRLRVVKTKVASWAKKFEVRTPASSSAVRGTDFVVDSTPERTEVLVFEGTVEVSDLEGRRTVLVKAGEYSVVKTGELPTEPQGFEDSTVSQDYGTLFRSEAEMKAVVALLPPSSARGLSSTTVKLRIADASMSVNGVQQPIDAQGTKPVIVAGRTLVPIRAVIEAFGGSVVWEASTRKVTITLGDITLDLWIDKSQASLNGTALAIDSANPVVVPVITNGRTMLPLRFVAESLGIDVQYADATKMITLTRARDMTPAAPAAPSIVSPSDGSTFTNELPRLSWLPSAGADASRVQILSSGVEVHAKSNITGGEYVVPSGVLADGTYTWRVSAHNEGGWGPWSPARSFTLSSAALPGVPTAPVLVGPASGTDLSTLTPTLSWSAVPGATRYEVRIWVAPHDLPYLVDEILATTSYTVPAGVLSSGVRYGWTVFAGNSTGWGPQLDAPGKTASPAFTVQALPALPTAPVLISPEHDAILPTLTPTLSWKAVPGATKYEVVICVAPHGRPYVIDEVVATTSYTVPAGVLSSGVRYGWTVFAGNSAGWGPQLTIPGDTLSPGFTVQVGPTYPTGATAPAGVTATAGKSQVTISWDAVSGATSYNICWSTTSGVTKTSGTRITGATSPYGHAGRTNGTRYYYVVTAVNSSGESAASAQVSATPDVTSAVFPITECEATVWDFGSGYEAWGAALKCSYITNIPCADPFSNKNPTVTLFSPAGEKLSEVSIYDGMGGKKSSLIFSMAPEWETPPAGMYKIVADYEGSRIYEDSVAFSGYSLSVDPVPPVLVGTATYAGFLKAYYYYDGIRFRITNSGDLPVFTDDITTYIDNRYYICSPKFVALAPDASIEIEVAPGALEAGMVTLIVRYLSQTFDADGNLVGENKLAEHKIDFYVPLLEIVKIYSP